MTKDEALKLALEALETCNWVDDGGYGHAEYDHVSTNKAITAIKEALALQEHDYKDLYEKEKRKSSMWLAKYEKVAGSAPKAIPMAQPEQEPVANGKLKVTLQDTPTEIELAQYKKMLQAACSDFGAINDALGLDPNDGGAESILFAIEELKGRSQEPMAWMVYTLDGTSVCVTDNPSSFTPEHRALPLYTTPPQRIWVGLTEDDKVLIKHDANFNQFMTAGEYADRVQQLTEARLKDLNT